MAQVVYYIMTAIGLDDVRYSAEGAIQITVGNAPLD